MSSRFHLSRLPVVLPLSAILLAFGLPLSASAQSQGATSDGTTAPEAEAAKALPTLPTLPVVSPTEVPTPRIDPQRVFLEKNRRQPGWMVSATGLQYRVERRAAGNAAQPDLDDTVRVNYEGRLIDGTVFDSTQKRGGPASIPLANVIDGWREGIPMMRVGEVWDFVIPSRIGYGPVGRGPIPGGATLVFRVELVGFDSTTAKEPEPRFVNPETEKRQAQEKAKEKKKQ